MTKGDKKDSSIYIEIEGTFIEIINESYEGAKTRRGLKGQK